MLMGMDRGIKKRPVGQISGFCAATIATCVTRASRDIFLSSCPGLTRPSTSLSQHKVSKTWITGTSPVMTTNTSPTLRSPATVPVTLRLGRLSLKQVCNSLDDRDMLPGMARRRSIKPRIVGHFDLPPERMEAGAPIERDRAWMIEGAGV